MNLNAPISIPRIPPQKKTQITPLPERLRRNKQNPPLRQERDLRMCSCCYSTVFCSSMIKNMFENAKHDQRADNKHHHAVCRNELSLVPRPDTRSRPGRQYTIEAEVVRTKENHAQVEGT